jgi:hypothetical protein
MTDRKVKAGLDREAAKEAVLKEIGGLDVINAQIQRQRMGFGLFARTAALTTGAILLFVFGVSAHARVISFYRCV